MSSEFTADTLASQVKEYGWSISLEPSYPGVTIALTDLHTTVIPDSYYCSINRDLIPSEEEYDTKTQTSLESFGLLPLTVYSPFVEASDLSVSGLKAWYTSCINVIKISSRQRHYAPHCLEFDVLEDAHCKVAQKCPVRVAERFLTDMVFLHISDLVGNPPVDEVAYHADPRRARLVALTRLEVGTMSGIVEPKFADTYRQLYETWYRDNYGQTPDLE